MRASLIIVIAVLAMMLVWIFQHVQAQRFIHRQKALDAQISELRQQIDMLELRFNDHIGATHIDESSK